MPRLQRVVAILFAVAAVAALLIALPFLVAAGEATWIAQSILIAVGGLALLLGLSFGIVAYFAFRGGAVAQGLAILASALVLTRLVPYLAIILRRGDDITWVAPVALATSLFAVAGGASLFGLIRRRAR